MRKALDVRVAKTERKACLCLTVQGQAWEEMAGSQIAAPAAFEEQYVVAVAVEHEAAQRHGS